MKPIDRREYPDINGIDHDLSVNCFGKEQRPSWLLKVASSRQLPLFGLAAAGSTLAATGVLDDILKKVPGIHRAVDITHVEAGGPPVDPNITPSPDNQPQVPFPTVPHPEATPTSTKTPTSIPPTPTEVPPTFTPTKTSTPIPPTSTRESTPIPPTPTKTSTSVPPTPTSPAEQAEAAATSPSVQPTPTSHVEQAPATATSISEVIPAGKAPEQPSAPTPEIPRFCPLPDGRMILLPEEFQAQLIGRDEETIARMIAEFKCEFIAHDEKQTQQHEEIREDIRNHDARTTFQHFKQNLTHFFQNLFLRKISQDIEEHANESNEDHGIIVNRLESIQKALRKIGKDISNADKTALGPFDVKRDWLLLGGVAGGTAVVSFGLWRGFRAMGRRLDAAVTALQNLTPGAGGRPGNDLGSDEPSQGPGGQNGPNDRGSNGETQPEESASPEPLTVVAPLTTKEQSGEGDKDIVEGQLSEEDENLLAAVYGAFGKAFDQFPYLSEKIKTNMANYWAKDISERGIEIDKIRGLLINHFGATEDDVKEPINILGFLAAKWKEMDEEKRQRITDRVNKLPKQSK